MLSILFLICAVVGGSLVAAQLVLSVMAIGGGHGLRMHHRIGSPVGTHHGINHRGGVRHKLFRGTHHKGVEATSGHHWGHWAMTCVLGMLNFQGVVSGLTVFGLVGLAANAARRPGSVALELGIAAALVMMASISGVLSMMTGLEKDGTVDLQMAVGKVATVYLSIPGKNLGKGKITVNLQQQFMEFSAVTFQDDLLMTGQKVAIVAVLDPATMLVVATDASFNKEL